jgi:hypothetical protein
MKPFDARELVFTYISKSVQEALFPLHVSNKATSAYSLEERTHFL